MMSNTDNPPPDYMALYDNLRNQNEKLRKEVSKLTQQRDEAVNDLREALFIKADRIAKQVDAAAEGEARLTDQKILTDFIMDCVKLKPREVVIKYRGSVILEVKTK